MNINLISELYQFRLEDYALNRKVILKVFRKSSAYILNTTFVDYFSNIKLFNDEW